ncbi:NucA/NucB deoxyribonuclease domain-containing protein [Streptomyces platensis]
MLPVIGAVVTYLGKDYATSDPAGPRECDEYPFASTYEGAGQHSKEPSAPKDNFSALPIPKAQNKAGGTILALFYDKNRILHGRDPKGKEGDAYLMAIDCHSPAGQSCTRYCSTPTGTST